MASGALQRYFDLGFTPPSAATGARGAAPPDGARTGAASPPAATGEWRGAGARPRARTRTVVVISTIVALSAFVAVVAVVATVALRGRPIERPGSGAVLPPPTSIDTVAIPPGADSVRPDTVAVVRAVRTDPLLLAGTAAAVAALAVLAYVLRAGIRTLAAQYRHVPLELASWLLVATGVFTRQNVDVASLSVSGGHLTARGFLVSLALSLALFPIVSRWLRRVKPRPGLDVLALPFAFGFFLDLARVAAFRFVPGLGGLFGA